MMNNNEFEIMQELSDIKSICMSTKTALDDHRREVIGPQGRLTQLEEEVQHDKRIQTYYNLFILPLIGVLHATARYLGIKV